jgi:uncharacterized protein (TIGR00106 family)
MLASFSIVPIGAGPELKEKIAEMIRIVDESGITYRLGPMETTIEGEEYQIIQLIMKCHNKMKEYSPRVMTHIAIDDFEGRTGRISGKVNDVMKILVKKGNYDI